MLVAVPIGSPSPLDVFAERCSGDGSGAKGRRGVRALGCSSGFRPLSETQASSRLALTQSDDVGYRDAGQASPVAGPIEPSQIWPTIFIRWDVLGGHESALTAGFIGLL